MIISDTHNFHSTDLLLYHKNPTTTPIPITSMLTIPRFPTDFAPPLVVIGVGEERLVETAELDPAADKLKVGGVEAVSVFPCADDVASDEATDSEEAGVDDVAVTDALVSEDAASVEEVVALSDDATVLLEDCGAAGAEDEGALELEPAPALGTGATTPP